MEHTATKKRYRWSGESWNVDGHAAVHGWSGATFGWLHWIQHGVEAGWMWPGISVLTGGLGEPIQVDVDEWKSIKEQYGGLFAGDLLSKNSELFILN